MLGAWPDLAALYKIPPKVGHAYYIQEARAGDKGGQNLTHEGATSRSTVLAGATFIVEVLRLRDVLSVHTGRDGTLVEHDVVRARLAGGPSHCVARADLDLGGDELELADVVACHHCGFRCSQGRSPEHESCRPHGSRYRITPAAVRLARVVLGQDIVLALTVGLGVQRRPLSESAACRLHPSEDLLDAHDRRRGRLVRREGERGRHEEPRLSRVCLPSTVRDDCHCGHQCGVATDRTCSVGWALPARLGRLALDLHGSREGAHAPGTEGKATWQSASTGLRETRSKRLWGSGRGRIMRKRRGNTSIINIS